MIWTEATAAVSLISPKHITARAIGGQGGTYWKKQRGAVGSFRVRLRRGSAPLLSLAIPVREMQMSAEDVESLLHVITYSPGLEACGTMNHAGVLLAEAERRGQEGLWLLRA